MKEVDIENKVGFTEVKDDDAESVERLTEANTHLSILRAACTEAIVFMLIVGFELKWFNDKKKYRLLNYKTFEEFAKKEFNLCRASAYKYIGVLERCAIYDIDKDSSKQDITLKEEYKGYGFSQLIELIKTPDDRMADALKTVNQSMSVREISKAIKNISTKEEVLVESFKTAEEADDVESTVTEISARDTVGTPDMNIISVKGISWENLISSETKEAFDKALEVEAMKDDLVIKIVISHKKNNK